MRRFLILAGTVALFAWRLPQVGRAMERGLGAAQLSPIVHRRRPLYEDRGGKWGAVALCVILILLLALTICIKLGIWP